MTEILKFVNNTDEVDLLDTNSVYVYQWEPALPATREITTFSQYDNGSTLLAQQYENVIETMTLYIVGTSQDQAAANLRNLRSILAKGVSYYTGLTTTPTYLQVKSDSESNSRYAVVKKFRIEKTSQVLGSSPFSVGAMSSGTRFGAALVGINLVVELSLYRSQPPGSYENALISGIGQDTGYVENGGASTQIVTYGTVNSSQVETPESFAYVASKYNEANITDVFITDASAGTTTTNQAAEPLPFNLFPSPVAAGDILYVGIDEAVSNEPGHFTNIVFDIASNRSIAIFGNWEYWNGAWTVDQVGAFGGPTSSGHLALTFSTYRSDEVSFSLFGRTGYWRRFIVTSIGGDGTTIQQQNRRIYTLNWPYVNIAASQVVGDEPALLRMKITNIGGGQNNGAVMTRVVAGARSTDRGSSFNAYINLSDEQNGNAVAISVSGLDGTFASSLESATGRIIRLNEAGPALTYAVADMTIGASNPHYSGRFRAFLGVIPVTVVALSDVQFFLKGYHGSSQIVPSFTTSRKSLASLNTELHYIDLGEINTIPSFKASNVAGYFRLQLGAYVSSAATIDVYCVNLVLIPVDEWSCDLIMPVEAMVSTQYLEVDSTTPPETGAIIKNTTGNTYALTVVPTMARGPRLQLNAEQRIWFLFFNQNPTSTIRMIGKIEIDPVYQYLTPRGAI